MSLELLLRAHAPQPVAPTPSPSSPPRSTPWPSGGIYDHLGGGFARYSVDEQLARAPLREDALRPGAARPGLPPRLAGHRRGALPPGARRDDRLRAPRPAPPRRRLLLGRGRRLARPRGHVEEGRFYVWTPAELGRRSAPSSPTPPIEWYGVTDGGNFEGRNILHRSGPGRPAPARRRSRRPAPALFDAREAPAPARARRQGAHRVERADARHARRGGGRHRQRRLARRRRRDGRVPARPTCAAPTAAGCAPGRRDRRRPATSPTPPTTPRSSTPSPGWPRPPARPAGSPRPATVADDLIDLFWDDEQGGVFTTGRRRRGPGHPPEGPAGQRHPVGQQPRRRRAAPAGRAHRRATATADRADQHPAACWPSRRARHPLAFAHLLAALDLRRAGTTEVAVVGDRPDLVGAVAATATCPTPC